MDGLALLAGCASWGSDKKMGRGQKDTDPLLEQQHPLLL